jgi:hypothetical protein
MTQIWPVRGVAPVPILLSVTRKSDGVMMILLNDLEPLL